MRLPVLATAAMLFLAGTLSAEAADPQWPRFRGPNGCGVGEASIPTAWTDRNYRWKVKMPGVGFSSPVIYDERLYLTSVLEDRSQVMCLGGK
jgi:hypothetical protein